MYAIFLWTPVGNPNKILDTVEKVVLKKVAYDNDSTIWIYYNSAVI